MRRVVGDADPYECVARGRQQKNRREATLPSCKDTNLLIRSHGLDDLDLTAIVGTALRAHSVRQMQRTALGACHQTLPSGLFITSGAVDLACEKQVFHEFGFEIIIFNCVSRSENFNIFQTMNGMKSIHLHI